MREVRDDAYGVKFYEQALKCGQSLWLLGLPAQALLMLNRALGADLKGGELILEEWPLPYAASAWVMMQRTEDQFIGNPRRHYQHLATRMVEPRKAQRTARAWACWFMACQIFPDYSADEKQIAEEGVKEPTREKIVMMLDRSGFEGEVEDWEQAVKLKMDNEEGEPVVVPITSELDLHAFRPNEIGSLLPEYFRECRQRGLTQVRVIHGKGTGTLREGVHRLLERLPEVESFKLGDEISGGWGATMVWLKPLGK